MATKQVPLNHYSVKDSSIVFDVMKSFYKANQGFSAKNCDITGHLTQINKKKAYSCANNLKNGRVILTPYEEDSIGLFNMDDGSVMKRYFPEELRGVRYIDSHQLHGGVVVMIPADSNKPVFVYDVVSGKYNIGSCCRVNGDHVFEDIFSYTVMMDNGTIFCANRNTNKPYLYNPYMDTWVGVEGNGYYQTTGEGSGCMLSDGTVFLTGRQDITTEQTGFQIYNRYFSQLRFIPFELECSDEFVGVIPEDDMIVWLLPYKGKRIVRMDLKDLTWKAWEAPENIVSVIKDTGITLGGCKLPNGNIFMSPFGIPYGVEFNITTKKWIPCPHTGNDAPAYTSGALLMCNGLVFCSPCFRKSGIVYGTEVGGASVDVFVNQFYNTSR